MSNTADAIRDLDARELRARLAEGAFGAAEVAEAYLARIAEREPDAGLATALARSPVPAWPTPDTTKPPSAS